MDEHTHSTDEPEPDAWMPLRTVSAPLLKSFHVKACGTAAATAALTGPHEKQDEESRDNRSGGDDNTERGRQHRAYVDQRVKEIAAFERRARGGTK